MQPVDWTKWHDCTEQAAGQVRAVEFSGIYGSVDIKSRIFMKKLIKI